MYERVKSVRRPSRCLVTHTESFRDQGAHFTRDISIGCFQSSVPTVILLFWIWSTEPFHTLLRPRGRKSKCVRDFYVWNLAQTGFTVTRTMYERVKRLYDTNHPSSFFLTTFGQDLKTYDAGRSFITSPKDGNKNELIHLITSWDIL